MAEQREESFGRLVPALPGQTQVLETRSHEQALSARLAQRLGKIPDRGDPGKLVERPQHRRPAELIGCLVRSMLGKGRLTDLLQQPHDERCNPAFVVIEEAVTYTVS